MINILDDEKKMRSLDKDNMLQAISDLPAQIENCWKLISAFAIPTHYIQAKNIVILGMGGSAVGGGLVQSLIGNKIKIPIYVHRDYDIPAYVNKDSLVIGVSYSGNTEETISGFTQAGEVGAKLIAISTGGTLASLCRKYRAPMFEITYGAQPRAALGYLLTALIGIFVKIGLLELGEKEITESMELMKTLEAKIQIGVPMNQNQAKQIALRLYGKIPVVMAGSSLSEVARRYKTQINENSKQATFFELLPEADHNMIIGLEYPEKLSDRIFFIVLQSKFSHERIKLREQITIQLIQQKRLQYETLFFTTAATKLQEMFLAIFFGDYLSFYLGMLNNVDPTTIDNINYLKDRLTASK